MALSPAAAEIIRHKKTQYCRFADTHQFHQLDKVALLDATFSFVDPDGTVINEGGVNYSFPNREGFCTFFTDALKDVQSIHSIGPGELEQTGPDEIKAIWTVIYHCGPKGNTDAKYHGTGGGHYHEVWRRQGDDWFMADLRFERVYWVLHAQV